MPQCWVALGGNLGDVEQTFHSALAHLRAQPGVCLGELSTIHRTAAVGDETRGDETRGDEAGGDFRNAAVGVETALAPLELLDLLQACETALGRVRVRHWGPRTLDLDLLLYGDAVLDLPRLQVPHPHLWLRRFVLDPLTEIAADVVHPVKHRTIGELRSRLLVRPFTCALAGGSPTQRQEIRAAMEWDFPSLDFCEWPPGAAAIESNESNLIEPALIAWLGTEPGSATSFSSLPSFPRLDLTTLAPPSQSTAVTLRHVLQAALGV